MMFIIQDGMPYLISGGRAFPVEITEKKEVIVNEENGFDTDKIGCLMLNEVIAKIGYTKKQEEPGSQPEETEEDSEPESLLDDEPKEEKKGRKKDDKE